MDVWLLRKVFVGGGGGWVAQQNRVTSSPQTFDFRLWTLDLECDKSFVFLLQIISSAGVVPIL